MIGDTARAAGWTDAELPTSITGPVTADFFIFTLASLAELMEEVLCCPRGKGVGTGAREGWVKRMVVRGAAVVCTEEAAGGSEKETDREPCRAAEGELREIDGGLWTGVKSDVCREMEEKAEVPEEEGEEGVRGYWEEVGVCVSV